MNAKIIVIDGKTYHSVDEMPPDIRQKYELAMRLLGNVEEDPISGVVESQDILADRNRNGVPDMLENIVAANAVVDGMKIVIDGREFNGIGDLSPQERARYDEALRKLDKNRNGIPDFVEGMLQQQVPNLSTTYEGESTARFTATETPSATTSHAQPLPVSPMVEPEASSGWSILLAGLFLLLLCAAGAIGVWYYFLR
jgi:hypothetical protein